MRPNAAIVLVTTSYPNKGDGSEAAGGFVEDLAIELAKRIPVRVVAPGADSLVEQAGHGLEVYRYAAPKKPLSTLRPWVPAEMFAILRLLRTGMLATRAAVAAGPTAMLIGLWALPSGEWARRVAAETGLPYCVWTLGSDIWALGRMPGVRAMLARVLAGAKFCFSDGYQLAEDTRLLAGREVEFLPSTRSIQNRRPDPIRTAPPYRLLFLGRWHPNKGVDLLLECLGALSEEDWSRIERVEIQGGGRLEGAVTAAVDALRASGRPVLKGGFLSKQAAEEAMLRSDLLVIPSRIESIPVVFSDAMKLGMPVVSMPVGDLGKLVEREPACGAVASDVSAQGLRVALAQVIASDISRFSPGVRDRSSMFDISLIAERLARIPGVLREEGEGD